MLGEIVETVKIDYIYMYNVAATEPHKNINQSSPGKTWDPWWDARKYGVDDLDSMMVS